MCHFKYILLKILFFCQILLIFGHDPQNLIAKLPEKLTVAASIREPFVVFDTKTKELNGLDVTLLREFGKNFNISILFIKLEDNLNEIFTSNSESIFDEFSEKFNFT